MKVTTHHSTYLRALFLTLLIAVIGNVLHADYIDDFTESSAINAPKTAVLITRISDGAIIAEHNADLPLIPASIMKCVTTATLLEKVGENYHYSTDVYTTGKVRNGILKGDLITVGSGDPSLNSQYLKDGGNIVEEIAKALQREGVDTIVGIVRIDESIFSGPAINPLWAAGDLPNAYGTGSHGLNFEDNASGKSSVKDPSAVFRTRLRTTLARYGIAILNDSSASTDSHRQKLMSHESLTIDEIMRSCMMRSDNQYAEAMLRTFAALSGKPGNAEEGAKLEINRWKLRKAPLDGVNIVDGSGLSRSNRMTARFMTYMLTQMSANPYYASFFPLAGQEGTLRKFLAGTKLDSYVAMKTGSMNGIQCYAGYLLDDDYVPTHTIVFMLNDMENRQASRAEVEKLLLNLLANDNTTD
jgi:D-alanyl-D-alanine carboxypeptidase/D-alanyl-D-alanine-endopeptidase (penicillin-binding protein 4)